jgi:hypothetical protein
MKAHACIAGLVVFLGGLTAADADVFSFDPLTYKPYFDTTPGYLDASDVTPHGANYRLMKGSWQSPGTSWVVEGSAKLQEYQLDGGSTEGINLTLGHHSNIDDPVSEMRWKFQGQFGQAQGSGVDLGWNSLDWVSGFEEVVVSGEIGGVVFSKIIRPSSAGEGNILNGALTGISGTQSFDFTVTTKGGIVGGDFETPLANIYLQMRQLGEGEPVPGAAVGLMSLLGLPLAGIRRRR